MCPPLHEQALTPFFCGNARLSLGRLFFVRASLKSLLTSPAPLCSLSFEADVSRRQIWRHCVVVVGGTRLAKVGDTRKGAKMQKHREASNLNRGESYLVRSQSSREEIVSNRNQRLHRDGKWNCLFSSALKRGTKNERGWHEHPWHTLAASISATISENILETSHRASRADARAIYFIFCYWKAK